MQCMQHTAYIALGSNLDNPTATILAAIESIRKTNGIGLLAQSSLYCTAPVGLAEQPDFINAVIAVNTSLTPAELLNALLLLEVDFGRIRQERNGPRTLDLDVLLYDQETVRTEALTLPHPRLHLRAFVLFPLAEIAPALNLPGRGSVEAWLPAVANQRIRRV